MEDVLAYNKAKTKARAAKGPKAVKAREALQKAAKKIGVDLDQEEALERVLSFGKRTDNFQKLNDSSKKDALENGVTKLVDNTRDGSIAPGSSSRDIEFIDSNFKGTSLGEKIANGLSRLTMWPQTQAKLFRSNNRIIRGTAQFISGSHISHRNYSSMGNVLTIEGITEGARREALPYIAARRMQRLKLGRVMDRVFDSTMLKLRMRGAFLKSEIDINRIPTALREEYKKFGGDAELLADMKRLNDMATDLATKVLDEAEAAEISFSGLDPRTYFPNRVSSHLSEEAATKFVDDFKNLRMKQLLEPNKAIDIEVADALGWINITSASRFDDMGRRMQKEFDIPEDSPFAGMKPKEVRNILNKGMNGLSDFEERGFAAQASRRDRVADLLSRPADLTKIYAGRQVLGTSAAMPVPESELANGLSTTAARAIAGADDTLNLLERSRSELALLAGTEDIAEEAAALDDAIALRRRALGAVARDRFANDKNPTMARVDMPVERQAELASDDNLYSSLSAGHGSLVNRLDEMLANGMIDETAKRIVMAAFVDVDPSKLAGMSFVRLDVNDGINLHGVVDVLKDGDPGGAIVRLADISQQGGAEVPGHVVAQTLVHETAHAAFLSASPRLQRTFQALFDQAKRGGNDIVDLFDQFGIDREVAMSNVHEFVAYLAEISLVSNKMLIENTATKSMLTKLREFMLSLLQGSLIGKKRLADGLVPGKFDAIERGVKNIFEALEDDNLTDDLLKRFDVEPAERVDAFGDEAGGTRAYSRRPKSPEDVTAEDILQAQTRLSEKFFAENKSSDALEAFTDVVMFRLFADGWPTDDSGKLLSDNDLFALATGRELSAVKKNIKGRGPGGDKKGRKASSMSAGERDLEFDSLDPEFQVDSAREELLTLIDAGLRSSAADARRAAKVIQDSVRMAQSFERRGLQQGERGAYLLTDEQAAEIAEELGMSKSKVLRHNYKNGLLNAENLSKQSEIVSGAVTAENRVAAEARLKAEQNLAIEEAAMADPVIQREIAATSVEEVDAPFPGYTKLTTDELNKIVDESNEQEFMARANEWMQPQEGEGSSYAREGAEYFEARKGTARVEEPEVETPARAEDAGGEEPPAPPEAPAAATPDPEPDPVKAKVKDQTTKAGKKPKNVKKMNKSHRLADRGMSLADIYRAAIVGDEADLISSTWKKKIGKLGFTGNESVLEFIGREYLKRNSGGFKADLNGTGEGYEAIVGALSSVNLQRAFDDVDLQDEQYGEAMADLFSQSTSSEFAFAQMAEGSLANIRIQKTLNEMFGVRGVGVADLFEGVKNALTEQASRNNNNGGLTSSIGRRTGNEINETMKHLYRTYIRARGYNPGQFEEMNNWHMASRIARNLTYSILGGKFALNVAFVEAPLAVLRQSGLNPLKVIQNTTEVYGSLAQAAYRGATSYKPMQDFMSKFGLSKRMMRHALEDTTFAFDRLQSSTMNRFQVSDSESVAEELMFNAGDRVRYHAAQVIGRDPALTMGKRLENFTGAMADATGMFSFMQDMTDSVRKISQNQAKEILLKNFDGLRMLARAMGESPDGLATKQIKALARKNGVPPRIAVYAAQSGLLSRNGDILNTFAKYVPEGTVFGKKASAGRTIDLNEMQLKMQGSQDARKSGVLGAEFDEGAALASSLETQTIPAVQEFMRRFVDEFSPELRGAQRVSGENPLTDLLMSLLTYPMAAYQALVQNGVVARGAVMTAGILVSLMGLEFANRNLQRVMFAKDEETQAEAADNLMRLASGDIDQNDILEVIALYGTTSPLFGAVGSYMRDLVGVPLLNVIGSDERVFRTDPFSSPAIGTIKRTYGAASSALAGIADPNKDASKPLARLLSIGLDGFTPINTPVPSLIGEAMFDQPLSEQMAALATGQAHGSGALHPAYSHPALQDKSFFQGFTADTSPQDPSKMIVPSFSEMFSNVEPAAPAAPTPAPAPAPAPQAPAQGGPLGPGSAGGNLADLLDN